MAEGVISKLTDHPNIYIDFQEYAKQTGGQTTNCIN